MSKTRGRRLVGQIRALVVRHIEDDPAGLHALAQHMMVSTTTIERALALPYWDAAFAIACVDALDLDLTITAAAAEVPA